MHERPKPQRWAVITKGGGRVVVKAESAEAARDIEEAEALALVEQARPK